MGDKPRSAVLFFVGAGALLGLIAEICRLPQGFCGARRPYRLISRVVRSLRDGLGMTPDHRELPDVCALKFLGVVEVVRQLYIDDAFCCRGAASRTGCSRSL